MFLNDNDFRVAQERYKDLLREAERERLIRAAGLRKPRNWRLHRKLGIVNTANHPIQLRKPRNWRLHRKLLSWIGDRMVGWGWKLQRYGVALPPCCPQDDQYQ